MAALRWKKEDAATGLARVGAGPRGSYLHDGQTKFATVSALRWTGRYPTGWFWVAGWGSAIPHFNSSSNPCETEAEAKQAAMAYVKKHLATQP